MKLRTLSAQLALALVLSACGGIESFYYYRNHDVTSEWHPYTGSRFETETGSATAFELKTPEYNIMIQLLGNWSGWNMFGYFFIPIVPYKSPGDHIDVTYHVTNSRPDGLTIGDIYLLLDNKERVSPITPVLTEDGNTGAKGRFRFKKPDYMPDTVTVIFDGTKINGRVTRLPDLKLTLHMEKCYWYGDSEQSYVNCPVRSK